MLTRPSPESSPEAPRESSAGRPAGTSAGPFALWSVVRTKRLPDFVWVYGLLVLAIVAMSIVSPGTLSFRHLMDLTRQAAPLGVVATGQTLLLMCGHIDLSYGAQITLCNVVLSTVMKTAEDSRILPAVLAAVSVAMVVGLGNGLAITKLRIPPFVATLAMALLIEGSYLIYTGGSPSGNIS